jgi:hypothetical protein
VTAAIRLQRICAAQIAAGNSAWVTDLRDKALALITKGKGQLSALVSASLNGKTFGRTILLTAIEEADICQSALAEAAGTGGQAEGVTGPDFSR